MLTSLHIHYTGDTLHTQLATVVPGPLSWIYRCRIARHEFSGEARMAQSGSGCHVESFCLGMKEIKVQSLVECEIFLSQHIFCENWLVLICIDNLSCLCSMYRSYSRCGFGQRTWLMAHQKRFLFCMGEIPKTWNKLAQAMSKEPWAMPISDAKSGTP